MKIVIMSIAKKRQDHIKDVNFVFFTDLIKFNLNLRPFVHSSITIIFLALFITAGNLYAENLSSGDYKSVIQKLISPGLDFTLNESNAFYLKGFKTFEVAIKDKKLGRITHKYIWVSEDKKYVLPALINVSGIKPKRIEPEKRVEYFFVDVEWFKEVLKKMPPYFKRSLGESKTKVYILSDPYCFYCKKLLKEAILLAEENRIKLHVIPFDIHGDKATKASILFVEKEKTSGLKTALNEIELASYKDIDKKVKESKEKIETLQKELDKYLKSARSSLLKQGLKGTPVTLIFNPEDKAQIRMGYFNMREILN